MAQKQATKSKTKKKKPPKLSAEERLQLKRKRAHKRSARAMFRHMGFVRAPELAEKQMAFEGQQGEFDDAFVYENLIVLLEYTISKTENVTTHLKKKNILFEKIKQNTTGFIADLRDKFPLFDARLGDDYHEHEYILKILYCSYEPVDDAVRSNVNSVIYLDLPNMKYFEKIAAAIKLSALFEFLGFINVEPNEVAVEGKFSKVATVQTYEGSILPEAASGFPSGYKVVSFYADAAALLERAYVLRREGWRGSFEAYQRMIQAPKIEAIRKKLRSEKQVFVNNLIATLPSDVQPVDKDGKTVDITSITSTEPVRIALPLRANSIGMIDGQHRLFSYYKSCPDDSNIVKLRERQNLLVTGIIYPENITKKTKERFEAGLFLSINSNQTNAPAALRQEIEVILHPFSQTAIGKQVMQGLSAKGPLSGQVQSYFFDKGKLKTTSIVSYGLGPLTKLSGKDSIFRIFKHPEKELIVDGRSTAALEAYIEFAAKKINEFLGAVRANVQVNRWTSDPSVENRILTVTYVNSFLITLRFIIENGKSTKFDILKDRLAGIGSFNFKDFHSSQYGRMAEKIFEKHF